MNKIEVLKLVLDALESCGQGHISDGGNQWHNEKLVDEAIKAVREVLAHKALDRMAENARDLGLDYEAEQPAPSQYGSPELQAMIVARAMEKDEAEQQGWRLVPYDPSIDMQEHGSIASGYDLSQTRAKKVYQAMIDMHDVMMEREPTNKHIKENT